MRKTRRNWRDVQRLWPAGTCPLCGGDLYSSPLRRRTAGAVCCPFCRADQRSPAREEVMR